MEAWGSLPHSQEPFTRSYPQQDQPKIYLHGLLNILFQVNSYNHGNEEKSLHYILYSDIKYNMEDLQIYTISSRGQKTRGGSPALGFGRGAKETPHCKTKACYETHQ
jgi:hypothetical protein